MSYPWGVYTANLVVEAALAWSVAERALESQTDDAVESWLASSLRLHDAVDAHRLATALAHVQGPDIDADEVAT